MTTYSILVPRDFTVETRYFTFAEITDGVLKSLKSTSEEKKACTTTDYELACLLSKELNEVDERTDPDFQCVVVINRSYK